MARVSPGGRRLIQRHESLRLEAYDDGTGVWTIGWGRTAPINGQPIRPGMRITRAQADALFEEDLRRFEVGVENRLRRPATQPQFDALVSLAYNIGLAAFARSSVLARHNEGDTEGVCRAFVLWRNDGHPTEKGLVLRRASEIYRYMGGKL
jgi:lysozyme